MSLPQKNRSNAARGLITLIGFAFIFCLLPAAKGEQAQVVSRAKPDKADVPAAKTLFAIDFSGNEGKNAVQWLKSNGFRFEKDAGNAKRLAFSFNASSLILEAKTFAFGLALRETPELLPVRKIRVVWGVDKYPSGASYENGLNREALMLYVFYGKEKVSPEIFLPKSPYYLGLFLSDTDRQNKFYVGNTYKTCGRYACIGNPKPGATVVSEFDIDSSFKAMFKKDKTPPLSGFSLEVDTGGTVDGTSKAFISRIEFLE